MESSELLQCPWDSFEPATIAFCEERLCAWVVEPANAWSNIAFIAFGLYIAWRSRKRRLAIGEAIGWISILEGFGSFFFHASGVFIGEVADVGCMYLISALFICVAIRRLWNVSPGSLTVAYVCLASTSTLLLMLFREIGIALFALQITVAVVIEFRLFRVYGRNVEYRFLLAVVLTFIAAFTFWVLDISKILCDPQNHLLTGHAVWHVLNALCLVFYARFVEQFERTGDWYQAGRKTQ